MAEAKKPGKEVIYLDIDDDITTIIDKVEGAKDKIVALVLPKRFATLQSIVNMRLLKRNADSASKNLVLITSDAALLPLAGAAGLHVAKSLQSKPEIPPSPVEVPEPKPADTGDPDAEIDAKTAKLDYHRSIGELAAGGIVDEPETIPLEDDEEAEKPETIPKAAKKDKKPKVPNFDRFRLLLLLGGAGLVLLIGFFVLASFVLPKAAITLHTEATPISANFELKTSGSADKLNTKQGIIPADLKKSDLTSEQSVQATGQKNNGKKASGSVTIKNCSHNGSGVTIPAGTGVKSSGGLYYITQNAVNIPNSAYFVGSCADGIPNTTGTANVVAQSGGDNYNTGPTSFSVIGYTNIEASGSASGGTDDIVTILSQGDVDSVADKISDEDKKDFVDKFKKELDGDNLYPIEPTLKDNKPVITASPAVGQPASTSNVKIKITYSVLAVTKDDLKKAITGQLNKEIDKARQEIGSDDVLKDAQVDVQSQSSPTVAVLAISEDTTAVPVIDEDAIKKQVGGQKAGEIKAALRSYPGVKDVEVDMSPFWVSKAPKKPAKIKIILEQVKTDIGGS